MIIISSAVRCLPAWSVLENVNVTTKQQDAGLLCLAPERLPMQPATRAQSLVTRSYQDTIFLLSQSSSRAIPYL
jgi:hypothetical protein